MYHLSIMEINGQNVRDRGKQVWQWKKRKKIKQRQKDNEVNRHILQRENQKKSEGEIHKDRYGRERGRDVVGAALQLVLLWPCPLCSLSHFLFLTWNLYLEPSLLAARHSWLNSESREMNAGLKSVLHSPQNLRLYEHMEPAQLARRVISHNPAEVSFRLSCLHEPLIPQDWVSLLAGINQSPSFVIWLLFS